MSGLPQVLANLEKWGKEKKAGCTGVARTTASQMQNYARQNRRWQDQTGNARAGLHGGSFWENAFLYAYIAHAVEYGVYLELAHDRKYQILEETANKFRDEFYKSIEIIMKYT
jgi:hypothetical protein